MSVVFAFQGSAFQSTLVQNYVSNSTRQLSINGTTENIFSVDEYQQFSFTLDIVEESLEEQWVFSPNGALSTFDYSTYSNISAIGWGTQSLTISGKLEDCFNRKIKYIQTSPSDHFIPKEKSELTYGEVLRFKDLPDKYKTIYEYSPPVATVRDINLLVTGMPSSLLSASLSVQNSAKEMLDFTIQVRHNWQLANQEFKQSLVDAVWPYQ